MLSLFASKGFRAELDVLSTALTGSSQVDRWKNCVERSDDLNTLGYATSRMFLRKTAHNDGHQIVLDMINRIRNALILNMKDARWMDSETYRLAIEKANYIISMVSYPDFIMNDDLLNKK